MVGIDLLRKWPLLARSETHTQARSALVRNRRVGCYDIADRLLLIPDGNIHILKRHVVGFYFSVFHQLVVHILCYCDACGTLLGCNVGGSIQEMPSHEFFSPLLNAVYLSLKSPTAS